MTYLRNRGKSRLAFM